MEIRHKVCDKCRSQANGICFAVTFMFVGLGSADNGTFGWWLLLILAAVCWVFQYLMMLVRHSNQ